MGRLVQHCLLIATTQVPLGFTAIVDKALSAKYDTLVNSAPELIKVLPWGAEFEVDQFKKPDFTALEILHFATGGKAYRRRHMTCLRSLVSRYTSWNQCKLFDADQVTT